MGGRGSRTECNVHMQDVASSFLRILPTGALPDPMRTSPHLAKYVHVTNWAKMRS